MHSWLSKRLWIIVIAAFTAYYLFYIRQSTVDVVCLTMMEMAGMAGRFLEGKMEWGELLVPYGEHGLLGYRLLALLNAKIFGFRAYFDASLIAAAIIGTALIVYSAFRRSLQGLLERWQIDCLFVVLAFILFTVTQGVGSGMDTQVRISVVIGFASVAALEKALRAERTSIAGWVATLALIPFSIIVFGTAYSGAWVGGYAAVIGGNYRASGKLHRMAPAAALAVFSSWVIYVPLFSVLRVLASAHPAAPAATHIALLERAWMFIKYFAATLGTGIMTLPALEAGNFGARVVVLNGFLFAAVTAYAIWRFFASGLASRVWLPVALMTYSWGVILLVGIGRFADWAWAANEWYTVHYKMGVAGVAWILIFDLARAWHVRREAAATPLQMLKDAALPLLALLQIMIAMTFSTAVAWKTAPFVRAYHAGIASNFCLSEWAIPVDQAGNTPFLLDLATTRNALRMMKKHHLYMRCEDSDQGIGSSMASAALSSGWQGEENNSRWIARRAAARLRSGPKGRVMATGFLPASLPANRIHLSAGGECESSAALTPGASFKLDCAVPKDGVFDLVLSCDKSVVPAQLGINGDQRELCVVVTALEAQ